MDKQPQTTPQEIGLELVKLLMTGKQPCKKSDELWAVAIKLLGMPWEVEILSHQWPQEQQYNNFTGATEGRIA